MRRLLAYREAVTATTEAKDFGRLEFTLATNVTVSAATLLLRFTYNYIDYALVCKSSTDTWDSSLATTLGLDATTVGIVVDKTVGGFVPLTVGSDCATATGCELLFSTVGVNTLAVAIRATESSTPKAFSITSENASFISATDDTSESIDVAGETITLSDAIELDIDDETAIGFTFKSFDIRKPDNIGIAHSNAFTLPRTANNEQVHGFTALNDWVYDRWQCDYIIDNEYIIKGGRFMVEAVGDRINCSIFGRDSAWDAMAKESWSDFMVKYVDWLIANETTTYASLSAFVTALAASTEHLKLAGFYGDLFTLSERAQSLKETGKTLYLQYSGIEGGHICTFSKSIFEAIASIYGVDFMQGSNSIFLTDTSYFQNRHVGFRLLSDKSIAVDYNRGFVNTKDGSIEVDKEGLTVVDFIKSFILAQGVILDRISESEYSMQPIDDLGNAPIYDLTGLSADEPIEFMPLIDGVGQQSIIDFESYAETIQWGGLAKTLICNNKNAEARVEYLKISSHVPAGYINSNYIMLGLFDKGSNSKFTFLKSTATTDTFSCTVQVGFGATAASAMLNIASVMAIPYDYWGQMIYKPVVYKVGKWLNPVDIQNLRFYQRYWVQELNGNFYLSEVSGLNPEGSKSPTTLELILINRNLEYTITATWGEFVCEKVDE
jgi:hypothetical protein